MATVYARSETIEMSLKRAGFFRELRHGQSTGPSIAEAKGGLSGASPTQVCGYLEAAAVLAATASLADDWFDDSKKGVAELGLRTDGVWVWPNDLAYYVKNYQVSLPMDFLEHMAAHNWVPEELSPEQLLAAETAFFGG